MAHEFVGERAAHAFEEHRPDPVFEYAAMARSQDIGEVFTVGGAACDELVSPFEPGVRTKAEITEPARKFGDGLRRNVGIALPVDMFGADEFLSREQRDLRLAENVHDERSCE